AVIDACARVPRRGQGGTWIVPELRTGFLELHRLGLAHSAEAWLDGELVGGCYGLALGRAFCGESMFFRRTDASKVAFVELVHHLREREYFLVDCQIHTHHLESLGAREIPRERFLTELDIALEHHEPPGLWTRERSRRSRDRKPAQRSSS
ncbi:MAG: leucyl/phenylalanyl-tRNA--protein transferase, partial [Holophagales bacterium]|nr:leucyl/phenylalanyl-tRNA--protein transferase [Holophagales bacterium]